MKYFAGQNGFRLSADKFYRAGAEVLEAATLPNVQTLVKLGQLIAVNDAPLDQPAQVEAPAVAVKRSGKRGGRG